MLSKFLYFIGLIILFFCNEKAYPETYLEAYSGIQFGSVDLSDIKIKNIYGHQGLFAHLDLKKEADIKANFIGGFKLGSWFGSNILNNKIGKYFGAYLDSSFDFIKYNVKNSDSAITYREDLLALASTTTNCTFLGEGSDITIGLLAAMRFGFCPMKDKSFGIVQPYFAIGPALLISTQKAKIFIESNEAESKDLFVSVLKDQILKTKSKTALNGALAIDVGLRYMVFKSLLFNTTFKYRYSKVQFNSNQIKWHPALCIYSCEGGLCYQF